LALCIVFLLVALAASSKGATNESEARIAIAMQGSQRFASSRSLDDLKSSIDSLAAAVEISPSATDNISARREIVRAYAAIFKQIDVSVDPAHNPSDFSDAPTVCVVPPPEGSVQLPPCADPADIKDPKLRSTYLAAIKENDTRIQRRNFQTGLQYLDSHTTAGLYLNLFKFRAAHTPDDSVELNKILLNARLSRERKANVEGMLTALVLG
jgi:hypothetical protein